MSPCLECDGLGHIEFLNQNRIVALPNHKGKRVTLFEQIQTQGFVRFHVQSCTPYFSSPSLPVYLRVYRRPST